MKVLTKYRYEVEEEFTEKTPERILDDHNKRRAGQVPDPYVRHVHVITLFKGKATKR